MEVYKKDGIICGVVWSLYVAYMCWNTLEASTMLESKKIIKHKLESGWNIISRKQDHSDIEWIFWKGTLFPKLCYFIIAHIITSLTLQYANKLQYRKYIYVTTSMCFLLIHVGFVSSVIYVTKVVVVVAMSLTSQSKRAVWITSLVLFSIVFIPSFRLVLSSLTNTHTYEDNMLLDYLLTLGMLRYVSCALSIVNALNNKNWVAVKCMLGVSIREGGGDGCMGGSSYGVNGGDVNGDYVGEGGYKDNGGCHGDVELSRKVDLDNQQYETTGMNHHHVPSSHHPLLHHHPSPLHLHLHEHPSPLHLHYHEINNDATVKIDTRTLNNNNTDGNKNNNNSNDNNNINDNENNNNNNNDNNKNNNILYENYEDDNVQTFEVKNMTAEDWLVESDWLLIMCYNLYLPLLVTGPFITFDSFSRQFQRKQQREGTRDKRVNKEINHHNTKTTTTPSTTPTTSPTTTNPFTTSITNPTIAPTPFSSTTPPIITTIIKNIIKSLTWAFLLDLAYHFSYHHAILLSSTLMRKLSLWSVAGAAYLTGQCFMVKYFIIWSLTSSISLVDHITTAQPPHCISHIYLYSHMWKKFDKGFYEFLKNYIYIPLGGQRSQLVSLIVPFIFVFLWHGVEGDIAVWTSVNVVALIIEKYLNDLYSSESFMRFCQKNLSPLNSRRLQTLIMLPLFGFSSAGIFVFLGNFSASLTLVYRLFWGSFPSSFLHLLVVGYCFVQFSKYRSDLKPEKDL